MHLFLSLVTLLVAAARFAMAQSVFAHVIVGNTAAYTVTNWEADIRLASSKGIDAFVLNIAPPLSGVASSQSALAFQAVHNLDSDFKLFFSFDYMGSADPWAMDDVITLLKRYGSDSAHFKYEGKPFVSTFEGPSNSDVSQWATIRTSIPGGIYFVPDWSSQGPGYRMDLIDGAFSWNMWPDGPQNSTTEADQGWLDSLRPAGKTFVMGISPWFYTDLPAFDKAWVWRGDSLWFDRWQQAVQLKPDFIEIVTWNDFGESHYIGPIFQPGIPQAATDFDARPYVEGYEHTGWLETLHYQIAAYKHAVNPAEHPAPKIRHDKIVYWYRTAPASAGTTEATGNDCPSAINAGGYQTCYPVDEMLEDAIFAIALLSKPGSVWISVGNHPAHKFGGLHAGINFISRPFDGETGPVQVRSSNGVRGVGRSITSAPASGVANFNAWVGCAGHCSYGSWHGGHGGPG